MSTGASDTQQCLSNFSQLVFCHFLGHIDLFQHISRAALSIVDGIQLTTGGEIFCAFHVFFCSVNPLLYMHMFFLILLHTVQYSYYTPDTKV